MVQDVVVMVHGATFARQGGIRGWCAVMESDIGMLKDEI
jgi:hypothetical protein